MARKSTNDGVPKTRLAALNKVAKKMSAWQPAREALTRVQAVPTIFPQINWGTRVGGWPIQRVALVHGPSAHGKTSLAHGLGLSFLHAGHFYGYVDAEFTTPEDWLVQLMGEMADHPGFQALRPSSYERTVAAVRQFCETVAEAREKKEIPANTTALLVVDSIRKLVPERLMETIEAQGDKGGVDGMSGRAAQYKAALNSAWMDELVPLLYHTNTAMLIIARESENTQAGKYSPGWKLTGGKGLFFDSSLVVRVTRARWVKDGAGATARIVGERHCAQIYKSKIAGKKDKAIDCYFHTSNGVLIPAGFDSARDVLDVAKARGIVKSSGGWLQHDASGEVWHGESAAVVSLTNSPQTLADLEREVEEKNEDSCHV